MKPIVFKNADIEARIQEKNILRGTLSGVMGLKFAGSDVSPFLYTRTVHDLFPSDCQMMRNNSVIKERS